MFSSKLHPFQTMATNPKYVLTPFMLSALLTICNVSRYLESVRLSVSSALPFIRSVIQNNEKEVELCNNSAWFRDTLEHSTVDVNKVYSILVEQRLVFSLYIPLIWIRMLTNVFVFFLFHSAKRIYLRQV